MPSADRVAVTDADFYLLEQSLEPAGRQLLQRVREFMEKSVQPVINHYWTREEFPHDLSGPAPGSASRHRLLGIRLPRRSTAC